MLWSLSKWNIQTSNHWVVNHHRPTYIDSVCHTCVVWRRLLAFCVWVTVKKGSTPNWSLLTLIPIPAYSWVAWLFLQNKIPLRARRNERECTKERASVSGIWRQVRVGRRVFSGILLLFDQVFDKVACIRRCIVCRVVGYSHPTTSQPRTDVYNIFKFCLLSSAPTRSYIFKGFPKTRRKLFVSHLVALEVRNQVGGRENTQLL